MVILIFTRGEHMAQVPRPVPCELQIRSTNLHWAPPVPRWTCEGLHLSHCVSSHFIKHTFLEFRGGKKQEIPYEISFSQQGKLRKNVKWAHFLQAKWNIFMFYSCKVKALFLCSITNWICSCKLLLKKKNQKQKKVKKTQKNRNTKASSREWKLRRPMRGNRMSQWQTNFIYCFQKQSGSRAPNPWLGEVLCGALTEILNYT